MPLTLPLSHRTRPLLAALGLLLLTASQAGAFSTGPPNGRTGAPGELTCNDSFCHNSFILNSGTGSLTLVGVPGGEYEPGTKYRMQLTLADPNAQRWGFELTVLDGAGNSVGSLDSVDTNTQTNLDTFGTGRLYIKHTAAGTALGTTGSRTWEFDWSAPAEGTGDVTFYFAGNAANGNLVNTGDMIYTNSLTVSEATTTSVTPRSQAPLTLLPNRPNPFNPSTTLSFRVEETGWVRVAIYDVRGQRIRTLIEGSRPAGTSSVDWDGRDDAGRPMASGTYLVRVSSRTHTAHQSIALVK